jgi:hypothetical protein
MLPFLFPLPPIASILRIASIDAVTMPPPWLMDRISSIRTDQQGITVQLKSGEKIKSVVVTPPGWVQVLPLDGVLCKEGSCSGAAPTAVLINKSDRIPAKGMSIVTITTNSRNIYQFKVRYGAPDKRKIKIGG